MKTFKVRMRRKVIGYQHVILEVDATSSAKAGDIARRMCKFDHVDWQEPMDSGLIALEPTANIFLSFIQQITKEG